MRVDLNLYRNTNFQNQKKQNKNISMSGKLPNFAKYSKTHHNLGNETEFNKKNIGKVISSFKNGDLASILSYVVKEEGDYYLPKNTVDFFTTFDRCLENVKDKKIVKYVNKQLQAIKDNHFSDNGIIEEVKAGMKLCDLSNAVDAYNTLNGNYSRLSVPDFWAFTEIRLNPSLPKGYLNYLKDNMPSAFKDFNSEILSYFTNHKKRDFWHPVKEFTKMEKFDPIANFSATKNNEIENYIYEKYYLKSNLMPLPHRKILSNIYKDYGVKVVSSDGSKYNVKILEMIEKELNNWKTHSKGIAKYPTTLTVTPVNENFISRDAMAYVDMYGNLYLNSEYDLGTLSSTLRHELTHINENKQSHLFDYTNDKHLSELVNSIIKGKEVPDGYGTKTVLDFDKCKYREEFLKAGIPPYQIRYAYSNKTEFLAVISEGELSRCSDEFKNILVEMGLPKYMFDMPNTLDHDIAYNAVMVENIMEIHPNAKTYDEIMKYY